MNRDKLRVKIFRGQTKNAQVHGIYMNNELDVRGPLGGDFLTS
jgi:hypothetical protein